jgi:hypothetical protein
MLVLLALRLRRKDQRLKASLGYKANLPSKKEKKNY